MSNEDVVVLQRDERNTARVYLHGKSMFSIPLPYESDLYGSISVLPSTSRLHSEPAVPTYMSMK